MSNPLLATFHQIPQPWGQTIPGLRLFKQNLMITIVTRLLFHVILLTHVPLEHIIPLGSMAVNSISKLTQLTQSSMYSLPNAPTLADLEDDTHEGRKKMPGLVSLFCFQHPAPCLAHSRYLMNLGA